MRDSFDPKEDVPLSVLSSRLPNRASYWTLYKWATKGVTSASGQTVKLVTVKLTCGRGSSVNRVNEFAAKVQQ